MNKQITYCLMLFASLSTQTTLSQSVNDVVGARQTALSGYNSTLTDVWSAANNQGGLGFNKAIGGGVFYENRFLLKETSYKSAAFTLPVKTGSFGLNINTIGFELYNQTGIGLAYGQQLSEKFAAGVQLNYVSTSLSENYGSNNSLTTALGLMAKITEDLIMAAHIYNPTQTKLADYNNEKIPTIMKLGLQYHFSKKVWIGAETEKDIDYNPVVRVAIEYYLIDKLYLRTGVASNPTTSAFGFGLILNDFKIDLASSFHQTLGITPSVSLIYSKNK